MQPAADDSQSRDVISRVLSGVDTLREVTSAKNAEEALEILAGKLDSTGMDSPQSVLEETHGTQILDACLERGSFNLALSIYEAMCTSSSTGSETTNGRSLFLTWPRAGEESTVALILGLCRLLRVADAMEALDGVRRQGMPKSDEVPFGHVVTSPVPPNAPLGVVQPQEGVKTVACASSRYEFELFSGTVMDVSSEAMPAAGNLLLMAMNTVRVFGKPVGAVHEMLVQTPAGPARTFRFGTELTDVPAQKGDRVTVVCAPSRPSGLAGMDHNPAGTRPGEPMCMSNHATGAKTGLIRAPPRGQTPGVPGWLLPAAIVLAGTDAASALVDPNYPLLGAAGVAALLAAGFAGNQVLIPKLKQLPEASLQLETVQQKLLAQHQELQAKIGNLLKGCEDDIRTLARLWQLRTKMASVGTSGKYDSRLGRTEQACGNLEARLSSRVKLLDGFCRVAKMIEIEVEMDAEVPAAELQGIEQQIEQLQDLEGIQREVAYQVEAQEEVERLLKAS